MKILNIYFKNINSLEGENRINFEQAPFSDTGVFAITGPNGSGKSSILDAITLGLYGETFRFDRPARHVMTKRSAECFSEIEFSLGQDKYRSSWHARREGGDPDGELLPAEMQLLHLNGAEEILAATPQQVSARIAEITGMNFRSFTRSILLAQGDFAAFLNALDSERMAILEKIISTDIYEDYKKEVTEKAEQAQSRLDRLTQELALIPVLDTEKLEAGEHDLADFNEQFTGFQYELNSLKQQQYSLQTILALQTRIAEQEKDLSEAQALAAKEREKLQKIDGAQDALRFQDEVTAINDKNKAIQQSKSALAALQGELKQLENSLAGSDIAGAAEGRTSKSVGEQQQTIADIRMQMGQVDSARYSESMLLQSLGAQINEKKSALATVDAWLEQHLADEPLLENFPETAKLKSLKAELAASREKQKAFSQWTKQTTSSMNNTESAIEKEKNKIAQLQLQLRNDEKSLAALLQGRQPEAIEDLRLEQQERVRGFKELNQLAHSRQKLTHRGFGFFAGFRHSAGDQLDADTLGSELENARQELKREENIRHFLEEAVMREALLKKMAADRHLLIDGKPCPLCGALQHPYARQGPAVSSSDQVLADQQAKIKTLRIRIERLEQQLDAASKQAHKNQATQQQVQLLNSQWLTLCNRLNAKSADLDINNIKLMNRLLKDEEKQLNDIVFLAAKYRNKQNGIEKTKESIAKSVVLVEKLQNSYQQLDAEWQGRPEDQVEAETALIRLEQEEKELTAKVIEQLALVGEKMPAKGKEDALFDRLNSRRQEYHSYIIRRNGLTEELQTLAAKEIACRAEIEKCSGLLDRYGSQLRREETAGLHLALVEKQKLIAGQQQLIAQQEADVSASLKALQQELEGSQYSGLNELNDILTLLQTQPELERHLAELEQRINVGNNELEQNQHQLAAEKIAVETDLSLDEINRQIHSVAEKLDITVFEIRHLENILKEQEQLQRKYEAVLSQLRDQEAVARQCNAERAQLTAETGMDFRRRVQARIAERLLSQTNAILEKISGRYYLRQIPSEQGLALEIEDTYQGNVRRLPKTLSGGESFVVSLALALGLSEMANNGKSIDSLFLDEGFGNLDAETLYTVITTLESLRTHGKIVGVISHVESVQKRFKAQLQVVKKPNGMGMLKKAS